MYIPSSKLSIFTKHRLLGIMKMTEIEVFPVNWERPNFYYFWMILICFPKHRRNLKFYIRLPIIPRFVYFFHIKTRLSTIMKNDCSVTRWLPESPLPFSLYIGASVGSITVTETELVWVNWGRSSFSDRHSYVPSSTWEKLSTISFEVQLFSCLIFSM